MKDFNRTLQEEFMNTNEYFEEYLLEKSLTKANRALTDWLIFYNFKRPHQTLNYQTPIDYIYYTKGVSAMYPSSTHSVQVTIDIDHPGRDN